MNLNKNWWYKKSGTYIAKHVALGSCESVSVSMQSSIYARPNAPLYNERRKSLHRNINSGFLSNVDFHQQLV